MYNQTLTYVKVGKSVIFIFHTQDWCARASAKRNAPTQTQYFVMLFTGCQRNITINIQWPT